MEAMEGKLLFVDKNSKPGLVEGFGKIDIVKLNALFKTVYGLFPQYSTDENYSVGNFRIYQGDLYKAVQANGPSTTVVTPGSDESYWVKVALATDCHNFAPDVTRAYSLSANWDGDTDGVAPADGYLTCHFSLYQGTVVDDAFIWADYDGGLALHTGNTMLRSSTSRMVVRMCLPVAGGMHWHFSSHGADIQYPHDLIFVPAKG